MDEKKPEVKQKATKPKAVPKPEPMIDWMAAGKAIEQEMAKKSWTGAKQTRNPRFVYSLVLKHILRPLVKKIHMRKG